MKKIYCIILCAIAALSCTPSKEKIAIIPAPAEIEFGSGTFRLKAGAINYSPELGEVAAERIKEFAQRLSLASGQKFELSDKPVGGGGINFLHDASLAAEEYAISISGKGMQVRAASLNGVVYALSSIRQMLPLAIYGGESEPCAKWQLPCCEIRDYPRFAYRGMHLDVSRHFFGVNEVKKYLDIMAEYKLNRFHWHLTDDQGWRIEIKKYPLLTEKGSIREGTMIGHLDSDDMEIVSDKKSYGGFYTREEIREVVKYAEGLGITIVPEIDLPGHMLAALASYPELGCTGGPYKVWERWGVAKDVLCVGKEKSFEFLENVLGEIIELFPGEYIHIGGDECPKDAWRACPRCRQRIRSLGIKGDEKHSAEDYLQNYVTTRIQNFLALHGRRIIGWDEILEGKLSQGATIMSWRGVSGGIEGAKKGFNVIMTPYSHLYFDFYQSEDKEKEPLAIGGYTPLGKVYSFDPYKGLPEKARGRILGVQANLWTEYIASEEQLEYMLLPRLLALSEVQWSKADDRDYEAFKEKLITRHLPALDRMGYNHSKALE